MAVVKSVKKLSAYIAFAGMALLLTAAMFIGSSGGSGALVFGTSPALTTPSLGAPSAVTLARNSSANCSDRSQSGSRAFEEAPAKA